MRLTRILPSIAIAFAIGAFTTFQPAQAQQKAKVRRHHAVKHHRQVTVALGVSAARDVLVAHGFRVVRVETRDGAQIIYYRRGNRGRGKGKGPLRKIVVRRVAERVVFDEAPDDIRVDIGIKLGIRL